MDATRQHFRSSTDYNYYSTSICLLNLLGAMCYMMQSNGSSPEDVSIYASLVNYLSRITSGQGTPDARSAQEHIPELPKVPVEFKPRCDFCRNFFDLNRKQQQIKHELGRNYVNPAHCGTCYFRLPDAARATSRQTRLAILRQYATSTHHTSRRGGAATCDNSRRGGGRKPASPHRRRASRLMRHQQRSSQHR